MSTQRKHLLQITAISCCCWFLLALLTPGNVMAITYPKEVLVGQPPADQDGDLVPDAQEDRNGDGTLVNDDTDQDGIPDYMDADDDADVLPTAQEDGNHNGDPTDDDGDGDGIPAYLDPVDSAGATGDSDNDGLPDLVECAQLVCPDSDGDGRADYMDGDDEEDGLPTLIEALNGAAALDDDGDGMPNYLDATETVHNQAATLGDLVWLDLDQDGIQDSSETNSQAQGITTGVPGLFITLYRADSGTPITTTRSDGAGHYHFANVRAGHYFMEFMAPSGYTFTTNNRGDDAFDSNAQRVTATVARTAIITVTPGVDQADIDVGLWLSQQQGAGLGGRVWYDSNQNGRQELGENGIGGVLMTLLNQRESPVATTYSDNRGAYHFTNLPAGVYKLAYSATTAYMMTAVGQGTGNVTSGNQTAPGSGRTELITLRPGVYDDSWRIGLYLADATGLLQGRLWYDHDRNGRQASDESVLPGIQVDLLTDQRQWLATAVTADDGYYSFANLPTATYLLAIHPLAGYRVSPHRQGDAPIDNAFYPSSGRTAPILLLPGEAATVRNGGLYLSEVGNAQPATLNGHVWEDQNRNGLHDGTEQAIAAITVKLYDEQGRLRHSTLTDEQGRYRIANLAPGAYHLAFLSYKGHVPTIADQGVDETRDSDVEPLTGRTLLIRLSSGENAQHWDAGMYFQPTAIALGSFQATFQQAQLVIQWYTTAEQETIGYYLAAGSTETVAEAKVLTREIIAGQGSTGGFYRVTLPYNPVYATPLDQLQLWLIEVAADGTETPWGPIGVSRPVHYLPVVLR